MTLIRVESSRDSWVEEKASRARIEKYADDKYNEFDFMLDGFYDEAPRDGLDFRESSAAWELFAERMIRNLGGVP